LNVGKTKRKEKKRREEKRKDRRKTMKIKAFKTETTNSVSDQRSLNAVEQLNVKTIFDFFC
jgi:hypothetical protein